MGIISPTKETSSPLSSVTLKKAPFFDSHLISSSGANWIGDGGDGSGAYVEEQLEVEVAGGTTLVADAFMEECQALHD
ncbi:protein DJ-1 C-like [Salvia divinorum]|uniref:Protein DJ-1 C-like n=1 Tax=Salvia divinorum TaxID=28513 RepID=A0ABD1HNR8_SALDI